MPEYISLARIGNSGVPDAKYLTSGPICVFIPQILGKTFFSTRRPVPEAGGQRPTARCALGRKNVCIGLSPKGRSWVSADVRQSVGKAWWDSRSADAARGADGSRRRCRDARGAPRIAGGRRLARRGALFHRKSPRAG